MPLSARQSLINRVSRPTALLTALICLWMSAGAPLTHTDRCFDAFFGRADTRPLSVAAPASDSGPELPCAACEWAAICALTPAAFLLVFNSLLRNDPTIVRLVSAVRQRSFYVSLRAPPSLL